MTKWIITLLFIPCVSFSSVNVFKLSIIYQEIITANNIKNAPKLKVNKNLSVQPNGYYDTENDVLIINQSLLDVADEDTIATTLGHELVHFIHKHNRTYYMTSEISQQQESQADLEGKELTTKAGYDVCKGFRWIYNAHAKGQYWHPDSDNRYKALGCTKE